MSSNVTHHPQTVTVTTTPANTSIAAGNGTTNFQPRAGFVVRNLDATATINIRYGSVSAAPYPLKAGEPYADTTSQDVVYFDVASGTASMFISVIY